MDFPNNEKITDIATASQHVTALSENSNVYYWGKNTVSQYLTMLLTMYTSL